MCGSCSFKLGIESAPALQQLKQGLGKALAVGVITNQTGIDQRGKRTIDILLGAGINLKKIFVPEHGMQGAVSAGKEVANTVDKHTGIPIVSLYGKGTGKAITEDMLKEVDVLIFDMQDAGMRHYTYIATLLHVIQAAQKCNKKIVVLDRPNPLGAVMEGPLVEKKFTSFASIAPIPLRHGMTIGELAAYFNTHTLPEPADLQVVKMKNYNRTCGLPRMSARLSPHIPTKASCYGYSFLGLLGEVRPFDVGVGTDKPFQYIGLKETIPFNDDQWITLEDHLKRFGVRSSFCSYTNKHDQPCRGLQIAIGNVNSYTAFNILLTVLRFFKSAGVQLTFSSFFDKAVGTNKVRDYVNGSLSRLALMQEINNNLRGFFTKARAVFLYEPHPKVMLMQ